jgi:hypothetical protein
MHDEKFGALYSSLSFVMKVRLTVEAAFLLGKVLDIN